MKITRDAFLYMDPSGKHPDQFGQCGTCKMSVPLANGNRCSILGIAIDADDSCGLYVPGKQDPTEAEHIAKTVTPEEAGFVDRQVRCENCKFFDEEYSQCTLFTKLNKAMPALFELDDVVMARGCCNAQIPKAAY